MLEDSWEGQICNLNTETKQTSKQKAQEQRKKGAAALGAYTVIAWPEGRSHKHRNPGLD